MLAGIGPIRSIRALEHIKHNVLEIHVPEHIERRLRSVPAERVGEEGDAICVETIQWIMPGLGCAPAASRAEMDADKADRGVVPSTWM
jgi:methylenetetrahydrofolate reductase (NADPH)